MKRCNCLRVRVGKRPDLCLRRMVEDGSTPRRNGARLKNHARGPSASSAAAVLLETSPWFLEKPRRAGEAKGERVPGAEACCRGSVPLSGRPPPQCPRPGHTAFLSGARGSGTPGSWVRVGVISEGKMVMREGDVLMPGAGRPPSATRDHPPRRHVPARVFAVLPQGGRPPRQRGAPRATRSRPAAIGALRGAGGAPRGPRRAGRGGRRRRQWERAGGAGRGGGGASRRTKRERTARREGAEGGGGGCRPCGAASRGAGEEGRKQSSERRGSAALHGRRVGVR